MAKSNLAVLMDLYKITPGELSEATGADLTLISRWRTGKRRLISGRHWAEDIAKFFVEIDQKSKNPVLATLMLVLYNKNSKAGEDDLLRLLVQWLTTLNQYDSDYEQRRQRLIDEEFSRNGGVAATLMSEKPYRVWGEKENRQAVLDALVDARDMAEPRVIKLVCQMGPAFLGQDEEFGSALMDHLDKLFSMGFRMEVALCVDRKMSEVSAFAGRWLAAHLMGHIKSFYYTEFSGASDIMFLAVIGEGAGIKMQYTPETGIAGEYLHTALSVKNLGEEAAGYFSKSSGRFKYDYFQDPHGFLEDVPFDVTGDTYSFSRMPHFFVQGQQLIDQLNFGEAENARLHREFELFFHTPKTLCNTHSIYQALCGDAIDEALDKPRHRIPILGDILGRRVYMTTQVLVNQLVSMRDMLRENKNYNVCFLPASFFEKLNMEIAVFGNEAAVGWIPGSSSTACKDPAHVMVLRNYCMAQFGRVPQARRTRSAALKRINGWLKRAKNYGYDV